MSSFFSSTSASSCPPPRVLIPFPRPNLKAFTPSPTSQISPLYPIVRYTLFLQIVFPQPFPCACLLPSLPASSAAPLTYIPRPYPPSPNPHLLLWRMWKSPNYFMTQFPHSLCPATPLGTMGGDSFPTKISRNVSQDLLAQEYSYLGAVIEDHHGDHELEIAARRRGKTQDMGR